VIPLVGRDQGDHVRQSRWLGALITLSQCMRLTGKQESVQPRTDCLVGNLYTLRDTFVEIFLYHLILCHCGVKEVIGVVGKLQPEPFVTHVQGRRGFLPRTIDRDQPTK